MVLPNDADVSSIPESSRSGADANPVVISTIAVSVQITTVSNVSQYFSQQPPQSPNDEMLPPATQRQAAMQVLDGQDNDDDGPGINLFSPPTDFQNARQIPNTNAYFKIGGYVKVDLIHDLNAIDSTDSFVTSTIPTSGPSAHRTQVGPHRRAVGEDSPPRAQPRRRLRPTTGQFVDQRQRPRKSLTHKRPLI